MTALIPDPDDETQWIVGDATTPNFGIHRGAAVIANVHLPHQCAGEHCIVHNPSDHHMRSWPLTWRDDKGVFERRCPDRGVGHPDPDDAAYLIRVGREAWTIHGCDGCCRP